MVGFLKGGGMMTKQELIDELWENGCIWANASYTKSYLQNYYDGMLKAQSMSDEELRKAALEKSAINKAKCNNR